MAPSRTRQTRPHQRRRLRQVPDEQGRLPRGLAHRERRDRTNLPLADRMGIKGARCSVGGAEAVLKLRAVHANDDLDDYRKFHPNQQRQHIHHTRYAEGVIPIAA